MKRPRATINHIRLGPERKRVLALSDASKRADPQEAEAELTPEVDWRGVISAAGLTHIEARAFVHHFRHRIPFYRLYVVLRCTPAEAARVGRTMIEKLRFSSQMIAEKGLTLEPLQHSRRLTFRERLPNGARVWSLTPLDAEFAIIMNDEKYFRLFSQRGTSASQKTLVICPVRSRDIFMTKNIDLDGKLVAARARLSELLVTSEEASEQVRKISAAFAAAEAAARAEAETALIESRVADRKLLETPDALKQKLAEAKERHATAEGAVVRHRAGIESIQAEISAGAHQRVLAFASSRVRKIEELQDALNEIYSSIASEAGREGVQLTANELFRDENASVVGARFDQLQAGLILRRVLGMFGPKDMAAA